MASVWSRSRVSSEQGGDAGVVAADVDRRLLGAADDLGRAELLELAEDLRPQREQVGPGGVAIGIVPGGVGLGPLGQVDARGRVRRLRHELPEFLGRVRDDRREQAGQRVVEPGQDELRGAAVGAVGVLGVEPVLEDVEIEARQLDRAELVDPLIDAVELELLVGRADVADHLVELPQGPAVDLVQGFGSHRRGVELRVILQVPQQVAERVADLAVRLGHLLDAALAHPDVVGVVEAGDVEPQDVGAILLGRLDGRDGVAAPTSTSSCPARRR